MSAVIPMLVFSNPDDVLAPPGDDGWSAAARALKGIEREGVPLVLCSSKTRAEIEAIIQALDIHHPFICEGGSAAFVPVGYFPFEVPGAREIAGYEAVELGRPYAEVVEVLRRTAARQKIDIVSFGDLSVEQVARDCQVSLLEARLATLREYGERFRLRDPNPATHHRLFTALDAVHLRCSGRMPYYHLTAAVDTSSAVGLLYDLYRRTSGALLSVGSSDAAAQFSGRPGALPSRLPAKGTTLVEWANTIVDLVARLRDRESRYAR